MVDAEERGRGPRNEDAGLVDEVVGRVEGAVMFEWGGGEGKEQHRVETEIDGVFGNIDEEKGEHTSGGMILVKLWGIQMLNFTI